MITNSAFLTSEQQKNKTLFYKNIYLHVTLFDLYFSGFWKEKDIQKLTFYSVDY